MWTLPPHHELHIINFSYFGSHSDITSSGKPSGSQTVISTDDVKLSTSQMLSSSEPTLLHPCICASLFSPGDRLQLRIPLAFSWLQAAVWYSGLCQHAAMWPLLLGPRLCGVLGHRPDWLCRLFPLPGVTCPPAPPPTGRVCSSGCPHPGGAAPCGQALPFLTTSDVARPLPEAPTCFLLLRSDDEWLEGSDGLAHLCVMRIVHNGILNLTCVFLLLFSFGYF